jgi:multidrug resistance efflux pump
MGSAHGQEEEFLPAIGRAGVHGPNRRYQCPQQRGGLGPAEELDDKITAKQAEARAEGLTDEQRDAIRNRIQEIRRERADTERDWRRAQRAIDDAERDVRDVRRRFQGQYGGW